MSIIIVPVSTYVVCFFCLSTTRSVYVRILSATPTNQVVLYPMNSVLLTTELGYLFLVLSAAESR